MSKEVVDARDEKAKSLGAVKKITFEDNKVIYLKKPHRYVFGLGLSKQSQNPIEAKEIILNNCLIKEVSDVDILENDEYFYSVIGYIDELVDVKKSLCSDL